MVSTKYAFSVPFSYHINKFTNKRFCLDLLTSEKMDCISFVRRAYHKLKIHTGTVPSYLQYDK